jgi:sodium/potassium/calcium exchanger 6
VQGVLTVLTFVQSVMWMDLAAGELVGLFAAIGRISGVSESLLGATVFAWGISVGDMVSDTTVARSGHAATAVAACFGGPMFNLLMGLAMGLVVATGANGTVEGVRLDNEIIVLAACQMCFLLYYMFAVPLVHKCRVTRGLAVCMLGFYILSQVLIMLVSTQVIFATPWM